MSLSTYTRPALGDWRAGIKTRSFAPWPPDEQAKLRRLWADPTLTRRQISWEMDRTIDACDAQAARMGISRPKIVKPPKAAKAPRAAKKPKAVKPPRRYAPGPTPKDEAGRAVAEAQAENIRGYWAARGRAVVVSVVFVPGKVNRPGCWSARIENPAEALR